LGKAFAKLTVSLDLLTIASLSKYDFAPDQVVSIEPYGSIPVFARGIRIRHNRNDYPENVIFWCVGSRDETLRQIEKSGCLPAGKASNTRATASLGASVSNYTCPHCGRTAIDFMRKSCLGPAFSAGCKHCGNKVSVSNSAMLAVIPFVATILASSFVDSTTEKSALIVAGFFAMVYIYHRYVPLVKK
jgi:hypothetical protein